MLEELLHSIGLSDEEVKMYLHLLHKGASTAGRLAQKMGMARPTVYDTLQRMHDKGVVGKSLKNGVRTFSAEQPRVISQIFTQRIEKLKEDHRKFNVLLPYMEQKLGGRLSSPNFQMYEGVEGVQNVLKDMLLYYDLETFAFWPIRSMVEMLSPDFFRWHNKQRIQNNLYTRALWPVKEVVAMKEHPYLGAGDAFKREIRVAPTDVHFTMGYWAYGNRVAFLSSQRESFGFIVESEELVHMLKASFDVIWNISKKMVTKPEDVKDFLAGL